MNGPGGSTPFVNTTRVLEPEQIVVQAGRHFAFLRLPVRASHFADRSLRLRQLAASHPMRDYLLFVADLVQAQHAALQSHAPVAVPPAEDIEAAGHALRPPVPAFGWPRDTAWRQTLRGLLGAFAGTLPDGPARDAARRVAEADDDWLEQQADRLSRRLTLGLDLAAAPLVAAGLQVYWTQLVLQIADTHGDKAFGRTEAGNLCPCCGSAPTASVTRIGADDEGLRYLHCALCGSQWHYVRIKCSHCESTKGIHFEALQAEPGTSLPGTGARPGAVKVECCDSCGHYLKQVAMEKDPEVEPVADDLASLTLDLLVSDAGHQRSGHNLLLLFGDPDPHDDGGGG